MINIERIKLMAQPGDKIITGSTKFPSLSHLIQIGQLPIIRVGEPAFSHERQYQSSEEVCESTIDTNPYWPPYHHKVEAGVQYNSMESVRGDKHTYGYLIHYKKISHADRQNMIEYCRWMAEEAAKGNPEFRYDVSGLFGSLLTYWALRWIKSNPLSGYGMFCTATTNKSDRTVLGKAYDASPNTDKNTAPAHRWNFYRDNRDKFEIIGL